MAAATSIFFLPRVFQNSKNIFIIFWFLFFSSNEKKLNQCGTYEKIVYSQPTSFG